MSRILLSDWTLTAFQQREEERRRRAQEAIAPFPADEAAPSAKETLRSEWTIIALQKRFAALEQRLAALEQREEERRQVEFAAAPAPIQPKESQVETPPAPPTIIDPGQDNQRARGIEQAEYVRAESQSRDARPLSRVDDQWRGQNALRARRDGKGNGEPVDRRPARKGRLVYAILYRLVSIMVTASVAAAIGFGVAVVAVPIEKATQFHSVVNRMLDRALLQKKH